MEPVDVKSLSLSIYILDIEWGTYREESLLALMVGTTQYVFIQYTSTKGFEILLIEIRKERMRMKKGREVSWGFQCLGYHIALLSYSLLFPSSKHSCFYFASQRIKHIEFAAYNHTGTLP